MNEMFEGYFKLKEIKGINKFNINKIENIQAIFENCKKLEYLDLSNFNTSNVIDVSFMFNECNNYKKLKE